MILYDLITIVPNVVPKNHIEILLQLTDNTPCLATVGEKSNTNTNDRNCIWYEIPIDIRNNLESAIYNCHETVLKFKYNSKLINIEPPQFLEYSVGGHYIEHNDCEVFRDGEWKKIFPRDISMLYYLNENYEGGEIEFTSLGLKIKPKTGMLISFPSYKEFPHKVHPVTSGIRHTIASWIETEKKIYETFKLY